MTDDDRMDRARRLRELREGGRSDDSEEQDSEPTPTADENSAMQSEPTDEPAERTGKSAETADNSGEDDQTADTPEDDQPVDAADEAAVSVPTVTETDETPTDVTAELDEDVAGISAPLPEADALESALDEAGADSTTETVGPAVDQETGQEQEEETRVLEFTLDDEHFCLDIEYIEEIVKKETITRVPNTPAFVEGVVDLRGQITTILNPKVILEKDTTDAGELIIVFDIDSFDDQGNVGWVVDDVRQVSPITESDVNDPPTADDHINGVIDRDEEDGFVIWTSPELTMQDEAEG